MAKVTEPSIEIVINTRNEEANIAACIESAQLLSDSIHIVDMESTDNTVAIAKKLGAHIYTFPFSWYVEPARGFGIQKASGGDWVFILDADERITKESAKEIQEAVRNNEYTHYKIPRKEMFAHKVWLKHGGWWPNHQIRLIQSTAFVSWPERIHGTPEIQGKLGYLQEPLIHYSKNDYSSIVEKTIVFEDIESELLYKAGRPVTTSTFFRKFTGELFRRLVKAQGYRDGGIGIIESVYQAFSKTITYLYLYEKKNRSAIRSVS